MLLEVMSISFVLVPHFRLAPFCGFSQLGGPSLVAVAVLLLVLVLLVLLVVVVGAGGCRLRYIGTRVYSTFFRLVAYFIRGTIISYSQNGHVPRVVFLKEGRSPSGPWWWWLMLVHLSSSHQSYNRKMKSFVGRSKGSIVLHHARQNSH